MENYLSEIQEVIERLRAIGEEVKEHHLVAIILCGLPRQFSPLITALETREGDEIKLIYVLEKLRDEAVRNKDSTNNYINEMNQAMSSTHVGNRRQIICHECKRTGHIRRNCPTLNSKLRPYQEDRKDNSYLTSEEEKIPSVEQDQEWVLNVMEGNIPNRNQWLIDSGASSHMCPERSNLINYNNLEIEIEVKIANGEILKAKGEGESELAVKDDKGMVHKIFLKRVLYVPGLRTQLISVPTLCDDNYEVQFSLEGCKIYKNNNLCGIGIKRNNSYVLDEMIKLEPGEQANTCIHRWHYRLGHRAITSIQKLYKENQVRDLKITNCNHNDFCRYCSLGAMRQNSFKLSSNHSTKPFGTLVSDICGPITPGTIGGSKYLLTVTDEATNYTHIKLLHKKSDAAAAIIAFINQGHNKFHYFPDIVRTDEGGEFLGYDLKTYLVNKGVIHQTSVPYTPQQNGRAERKNLTLMNMTRSMLKSSGLPKGLWGEAVHTAVYVLNRMQHSSHPKTPYELWHSKIPSVDNMRIFGCLAYAHVNKILRKKLDDTSKQGFLVGYCFDKKGYRIWTPGSNFITNAISVNFDEGVTYRNYAQTDTAFLDSPSENEGEENYEKKEEENSENCGLRRSSRSNFGVPAKKWTY